MHSADERSDMHSLALVGAFMVTGEWAIKNHLAEAGRIPEGLKHRLDPLLDPNPDNRPATWKDVRSLLTAKRILTVPMVKAATAPKKKVPLFNAKGSATEQSKVAEAEKKREKTRFVKTEEAEKAKLKEPKEAKVKNTRVKERLKKEKIERNSDEAQKERINLRKVAIVTGAVVVAVMLAMLPLLASSLFKENPQNLLQAQPQYISAPSFVGLSSEEAEQLAADNGILIEREEQFSNEVEAGKIMTQNPGQGAEVEEGFTVKLSVSKGPEIIEEAPAEVAANTITPDQQTGSGTTNTGGGGGTAPPATPASGSPPVAAFTYSPASGPSSGVIVKCNASGSYDPDGGPLSYSWSFGGSGVSASSEFVSSIAPVDKAITLTVTDSEGKKSSVTHYVHLY
jgi:hypothetical protein